MMFNIERVVCKTFDFIQIKPLFRHDYQLYISCVFVNILTSLH